MHFLRIRQIRCQTSRAPVPVGVGKIMNMLAWTQIEFISTSRGMACFVDSAGAVDEPGVGDGGHTVSNLPFPY
jgi:hypothetical protein